MNTSKHPRLRCLNVLIPLLSWNPRHHLRSKNTRWTSSQRIMDPYHRPRLLPHLQYQFSACPKELDVCPNRYLVFGFHIPDEWIPHCYQEAGLELDGYEEGYPMVMQLIEDIYEEVYDEVWPEGSIIIGIFWHPRGTKPKLAESSRPQDWNLEVSIARCRDGEWPTGL